MKNLYRILVVAMLFCLMSLDVMAQGIYFTESFADTAVGTLTGWPKTLPATPFGDTAWTVSSGTWHVNGCYRTTGSYLCTPNAHDMRMIGDASIATYLITPTLAHGVGVVRFKEGRKKVMVHGIWISTDNGTSWTKAGTVSSLATGCLVDSLVINNSAANKVKFVNEAGANTMDINIIEITSTSNLAVKAEPFTKVTAFKLGNYPNPFNPSTKITFEVPQTSNINLSVFNMIGQKVATLHEGLVPAGAYSTQFNASNLPSGMYIVRLQAEKATISKKVMLLK